MQFNFPQDYRKYLKWLILAGIVLVILIIVLSCARSNRSANQNANQEYNLWQGGTALPQATSDWDNWGQETATPSVGPVSTVAPVPTVSAQPTATASTSVRRGDSGETVTYIQQRLKTLGYYTGTVDGEFGAGTENAVKAFQSTNGLTSDGVVGTRTMNVLKSDSAKSGTTPSSSSSSSKDTSKATSVPARREYTPSDSGNYGYLELGSSGSSVRKLQNRLAELGYLSSGDVTGTYDATTEAAVITFQERNGEWSDGKAGPDTQTKLYSNSALQASSND